MINNAEKPQLTIPRVSGSVIFRDLCIGNLVTDEFYDSFKTIIKVNSIDERGINLEVEDDGNYPLSLSQMPRGSRKAGADFQDNEARSVR